MRLSAIRTGAKFGNLPVPTPIRGTVRYSISPMEQRAFAGLISKGLPNMVRRVLWALPYPLPPMFIGYLIYDWHEKEHDRLIRKKPGEFDHEQ